MKYLVNVFVTMLSIAALLFAAFQYIESIVQDRWTFSLARGTEMSNLDVVGSSITIVMLLIASIWLAWHGIKD